MGNKQWSQHFGIINIANIVKRMSSSKKFKYINEKSLEMKIWIWNPKGCGMFKEEFVRMTHIVLYFDDTIESRG